jgi:cytochrome b involved in lipid metabolism
MKKDFRGPRPRYFTPNEVSSHNTTSDIWVSFLGHVYDLSKLVEAHSGSL